MTQSLMLESERLKAAGWKPVHDNVHPQQTDWIDPLDRRREPKHWSFGEASREQFKRENSK